MSVTLTTLLTTLGRCSLQASFVAVAVAILVRVLRHRLSAKWRFNLWALVFARLLIPAAFTLHVPTYRNVNFLDSRIHADEVPTPAFHSSRFDLQSAPADLVSMPSQSQEISRSSRWTWAIRLTFLVWLAGTIVILLRVLRCSIRLKRMARGLAPLDDPAICDLLAETSRSAGLDRSPELLVSPACISAALVGVWRPRLLLSQRLIDQVSTEELRMVFLHELAHIRRRDVMTNCLVTLLCAIHWFNPLTWWAMSRLQEERELACDEFSLMASRDRERSPTAYSNLLLKLIEPVSTNLTLSAAPVAVALFERRRGLQRRIVMTAQFQSNRRSGAVLGSMLLLPLLGIGFVDAQTKPSAAVTPTTPVVTNPARPTTRTALDNLPNQPAGDQQILIDSDTQADAATNALLTRRLGEIRFNANSLSDCVDFLRDLTGANIYVDWSALDRASVDRNAPVSLRVSGVPLETALSLMLQAASTNQNELAFAVENGVIRISTAQDFSNRVVVHVYDLSLLSGEVSSPAAVAKIISDNVETDSWKSNGGMQGVISVFKNKLVITTTAVNQQKIAALLRTLNEHGIASQGTATQAHVPSGVPAGAVSADKSGGKFGNFK